MTMLNKILLYVVAADDGAEFVHINQAFLTSDGMIPVSVMPNLLHPDKLSPRSAGGNSRQANRSCRTG